MVEEERLERQAAEKQVFLQGLCCAECRRPFYINPVPPEQAAQFLHDQEVDLSAKGKR